MLSLSAYKRNDSTKQIQEINNIFTNIWQMQTDIEYQHNYDMEIKRKFISLL